jgi:hypothetical protein
MNSDYKKYSLDKLEEWVHNAMGAAEATPQEIYNVIKGVVEENYYAYKHQTSQAYELLALLNGNGKDFNIDSEPNWVNNTNLPYPYDTCGVGNTSDYCKGSWNDFWKPEEASDDCMPPWGHSDLEYLIKNKKDEVKKWVLPVQQAYAIDSDGEYFVNFPDDLLAAANLKEGDQIEWVDNKDGSYILKKVPQSYDEMIAAGYTMTADGFWIKE